MKSTLLRLALALLALAPARLAAGDPKADLQALVSQIQAKLKSGQRTEAGLAEEIAKFDALLAAHKGETNDDVAQILFMKATLYTQVINNEARGVELLKQLQADFPSSTQANRVAAMIKSLEAQAGLAVGKAFPDF